MTSHRAQVAVALASAIVVIPAVYAGLRAYDVLFVPQPNPALVSSGVKIAMFWRLWIGVYLAPLVAIGVHQIAQRNLARAVRLLHVATITSAAMIALQGLFLP